MKLHIKRVLLLIAGWGFILLGIIGLVVPFLQGVLFILLGMIILSSQYAWAGFLLLKLRKRFPRVAGVADQCVAKASTVLKRFSRPRGTAL